MLFAIRYITQVHCDKIYTPPRGKNETDFLFLFGPIVRTYYYFYYSFKTVLRKQIADERNNSFPYGPRIAYNINILYSSVTVNENFSRIVYDYYILYIYFFYDFKRFILNYCLLVPLTHSPDVAKTIKRLPRQFLMYYVQVPTVKHVLFFLSYKTRTG